MNNIKEFLSPKDLISMGLGSQSSVYRLFAQDDFPSIKIGSTLRVSKKDLYEWLENQK